MVDSTLILGDERALLIDAQFTKSSAEQLAEMVAASGRQLETIFITHWHPDHHFGASTFKARWPNVKIVAHPVVAARLAKMGQAMFDSRKEVMGDALPGHWYAPEAHEGDLKLEGERFAILDPMIGDTAEITAVDLPQFNTLVGADLLYNGTWAWLKEVPDAKTAQAWLDSLGELRKLDRATVIPGHRAESATNDGSGFDHTAKLLSAWQNALETTQTGPDLKAAMIDAMGELPGAFFLDTAVSALRP